MELTQQQQDAVDKLRYFLRFSGQQVFHLHGTAGSGKSTVISHVLQNRSDIYFVAPTGKAAHVLRKKGIEQAQTLHSLLYQPAEVPVLDDKGSPVLNPETGEVRTKVVFSNSENCKLRDGGIVVVDEASMVSTQMAEDLLQHPVRVIAVGDPYQLPPVMSRGGRSLLSTDAPDVLLTEIHRSALESPVTALCNYVRQTGKLPSTDSAKNGSRIIPTARHYGGKVDVDRVQVIVGMHKTRHTINEMVRRSRGISSDDSPQKGERLICKVNDKEHGVFNGMQLTVVATHFTDNPDIYEMELHTEEGGVVWAPVWRHGFTRSGDEKLANMSMRERGEALVMNFAYAITAHSAQGSEWDHIFVIDESSVFRKDASKWLYTAVSRASETVTVARRFG